MTWQPPPPRYNAVIFSAPSGPVITCCILSRTCSSHPRPLSCDAAAEEEDQAPLRVADVRVVLDALAAAKSDSLRAVLQGWLEKHVGAAGAAVGKKRKA